MVLLILAWVDWPHASNWPIQSDSVILLGMDPVVEVKLVVLVQICRDEGDITEIELANQV